MHPNLRWHFYIVPKGWRPAATENLSNPEDFTTAPLTCLAPDFKGDHLRLKFRDPSVLQAPQDSAEAGAGSRGCGGKVRPGVGLARGLAVKALIGHGCVL